MPSTLLLATPSFLDGVPTQRWRPYTSYRVRRRRYKCVPASSQCCSPGNQVFGYRPMKPLPPLPESRLNFAPCPMAFADTKREVLVIERHPTNDIRKPIPVVERRDYSGAHEARPTHSPSSKPSNAV
ncbi:hypothetical protein BU26DRAFT_515038 [Trematosphaeria pertusa]|uniref:Uncharacterized protein n=1 Tax=Trematosphaeria pertusa TaxID=390896 RepID=A0A6A6J0D1_9PLEO|nr:uncharacterized protein BU26DRAFT_515038 [Trematosphaeria pertusa]KAF2255310.1 hypothetical protein BU26DRAFT_515038 [Trematosphaeria pertusa]